MSDEQLKWLLQKQTCALCGHTPTGPENSPILVNNADDWKWIHIQCPFCDYEWGFELSSSDRGGKEVIK